MITVEAIECQERFLGILADVQTKRETVIVTNGGREVARLVPTDLARESDPFAEFRFPGKIEIHGDIVAPCYSDNEMEQFEQHLMESVD